MPGADEQHLLQEARKGSRDAYRRLVERHMRQAFNVAYGFVHNRDSARDIVQDALVRAFVALPAFRGDAEFGTWLHRIVMNLSLNHIRSATTKARREVPVTGATEPGHDHERERHSREMQIHVERALHELPTLQRAVVTLRHIEGLSTKQVSAILHCSEGTVKTHLSRGLTKLRSKLAFLQEDLI
jgi:RNA polymerase sigma-70 factor, ECF subfamily